MAGPCRRWGRGLVSTCRQRQPGGRMWDWPRPSPGPCDGGSACPDRGGGSPFSDAGGHRTPQAALRAEQSGALPVSARRGQGCQRAHHPDMIQRQSRLPACAHPLPRPRIRGPNGHGSAARRQKFKPPPARKAVDGPRDLRARVPHLREGRIQILRAQHDQRRETGKTPRATVHHPSPRTSFFSLRAGLPMAARSLAPRCARGCPWRNARFAGR